MNRTSINQISIRDKIAAADRCCEMKKGDRVLTPQGEGEVVYHMDAGWVVAVKLDGSDLIQHEYAINVIASA